MLSLSPEISMLFRFNFLMFLQESDGLQKQVDTVDHATHSSKESGNSAKRVKKSDEKEIKDETATCMENLWRRSKSHTMVNLKTEQYLDEIEELPKHLRFVKYGTTNGYIHDEIEDLTQRMLHNILANDNIERSTNDTFQEIRECNITETWTESLDSDRIQVKRK